MNIVDIAAVASAIHAASAILIVDNTFCTAVLQQPLKFGADLVVYSATKYLNGHSDVLCGAIVGASTLIDKCRDAVATLGSCLDPHAGWLLARGLRTLGLRMERHSSNALRVAEFLRNHDAVKHVYYPWLSDDPAHDLARRQMHGGGGMVSADIDTNRVSIFAFLRALRVFAASPSLGGVESLVGVPSLTSHAAMSPAERAAAGISDSLIRFSVGIEGVEDLILDLTQALLTGRIAKSSTA
jgi:cystathionine beta-lyase/cystathionine gamma-synthase